MRESASPGLTDLRRPRRAGRLVPHPLAGPRRVPYVYVDSTYLNVRNTTGQVTSMAVVVATGIAADGSREAIGIDMGTGGTRRSGAASSPSSSNAAWTASG